MISWIYILLSTATAVILVTGYQLLQQERVRANSTRPTPVPVQLYDSPGPVIASRVDHLQLDGLTIIPVTHLPPLKLYLPIPFTQSALRCSLEISSAEMAFAKLRVATSSFKARDTNREPLEVKASGLEVNMKGNTGMRVRIKMGARREIEKINGVAQKSKKEWSWRTSGRTEVELHDALLHLKLQLTKTTDGSPRLSVLSTTLAPGSIDSLHLKGFHPFGKLITFVIPYIRSTSLVSYPVGMIGDYLIREALEGRPVDELLSKFAHFASKHVDGDTYGAIVDDEREKELSTPLDSNSLVPPSTPSTSSPSIDQTAPSPSSVSTSTPFRFHAHLLGPTRLHSFRLPDFAPELYRSDGKGLRNTLQSLNLLTSEFKLLISKSSLQSITFESASVAFDPPSNSPGIRGGDLVITVAPLSCTLVSSFSLTADVKNPLLSWASGVDQLGEKGTSTTTVHSKTLQIRLRLSKARPGRSGAPIVLGVEEEVAALGVKGGKDENKALSVSDFTSIESRVELGSKLGKKLGEKVVNKLLEGLKTQLAQAASLIIAHFLVDLARDRLQQVLDQVDEKLRIEGGVEWGKDFETTPPPHSVGEQKKPEEKEDDETASSTKRQEL
ncbi:hypothetical protein JCM3765_003994 [Sporobolomyces pararoseus]